jgi:AAA15 family ATPase/GTPase
VLHNLTVKNYRCFEDFHIEGLTRVNLLVGNNNSGKTSLLEAIYLLVNQPESTEDKPALIEILQNRGEFSYEIQFHDPTDAFRKKETSEAVIHYIYNNIYYGYIPEIIEISSSGAGDNLSIASIVFNISYSNPASPDRGFQLFFEESVVNNENRRKDDYKRIQYQLFSFEEYAKEIQNDSIRINEQLSKYPVPSIFISTNKINPDKIASLWDEISLTPKEDKIIEALQIIEPELERISFTLNQIPKIARVKIKNQDTPIPLTSMGEGMNRMLTLAMMLVNVENGVLLVDEIETGLHYEAQTDMWRLLIKTAQDLNVQVFATTHSWDCISAFQEALEELEDKSVGKLFRLDSKYGKLRAVEYLPDELAVAVRQSIEVR